MKGTIMAVNERARLYRLAELCDRAVDRAVVSNVPWERLAALEAREDAVLQRIYALPEVVIA